MIPRRLLSLFLTAAATASATSLPYQGILTDDKGVPVPDGDKAITFAVFGQSKGGSALWAEDRTVVTRKGLFALSLGAISPLPDSLFARDSLFLNVTVSGADQVPRTPLGASPWAFRARKADIAQFANDVPGLGAKADTSALAIFATKAMLDDSGTSLRASLGRKLDTAALTTRLSSYATTPVLISGLGAKLDTAALTTRLAGYARASDLASYAKVTDLSAYATTAALSGKASTADLAALATKVGTKVDTAALITRLSGYAPTAMLAGYATTTALASGLGAKVDTAALTTKLAGYARTTDLASYATTASLSSYATTAALANGLRGKADTGTVSSLDTRTGTLESYYQPTKWKTAVGTPAGAMEYQFALNMTTGLTLSQYMVSSATRTQIANFRSGSVDIYENANVGGDLTVNGGASIGTSLTVGTSIKVAGVTMAVPDYVFEPDYKLASLAEVEAYTQENKHLPEIPSAKEIEAGGIDLAQMNLLLLKKVEELTLHAIAQEKRIQALEERVK